jgi:hypothetical protein
MTHEPPSEQSCAGCGQARPRLSGGYCLTCVGGAHEEQAGARALIGYVREHPGITVAEASRDLDVSPSRITRLIADGRLLSG